MKRSETKPFTRRWIYDLIITSLPEDTSLDERTCRYFKKVSKSARKAYLIGIAESRKGKRPARFRNAPEVSSELEQSAWRLVYNCYLAGHRKKG